MRIGKIIIPEIPSLLTDEKIPLDCPHWHGGSEACNHCQSDICCWI